MKLEHISGTEAHLIASQESQRYMDLQQEAIQSADAAKAAYFGTCSAIAASIARKIDGRNSTIGYWKDMESKAALASTDKDANTTTEI